MKALIEDLKARIIDPISTDELSKLLFQLGHENETHNKIIDIDITPNRGDCLSINGILRDLKNFYETDTKYEVFEEKLDSFLLDFVNEDSENCPNICFLKIEVDQVASKYKPYLESFFSKLNNNRINFFTDISNYISYELGQPTHCYDFLKINNQIVLRTTNENRKFKTLTDKEIELSGNNLVFEMNEKVINLAGVMGGKETACSNSTTIALIECAYFKPESIIGKSVKYDLSSEAAHKFERGVDKSRQEYVLRRFIKIVSDHANIKNIEFCSHNLKQSKKIIVENDKGKIEKILGITVDDITFHKILENLGFQVSENEIIIPDYRNDIFSLNDIAEEIARVIGYDNLPSKDINLNKLPAADISKSVETFIRKRLIAEGFNEVINNPFTDNHTDDCFEVDNPLDTNKSVIRTSLKDSLVENLLYNERRQKDSIKFFEISYVHTYNEGKLNKQKRLGIISSGRIGNNYEEFSKFINHDYLENIVVSNLSVSDPKIETISRENLNSKIKTPIFFTEIDLKDFKYQSSDAGLLKEINKEIEYQKISEFPSIFRDISFLITNKDKIKVVNDSINKFENKILKEKFIFDFYNDEKSGFVKIGFRFIFQSNEKTLKVEEVDDTLKKVIEIIISDEEIDVPGYK